MWSRISFQITVIYLDSQRGKNNKKKFQLEEKKKENLCVFSSSHQYGKRLTFLCVNTLWNYSFVQNLINSISSIKLKVHWMAFILLGCPYLLFLELILDFFSGVCQKNNIILLNILHCLPQSKIEIYFIMNISRVVYYTSISMSYWDL